MIQEDRLQRFLFEEIGVRGELVRLDESWRSVLDRHAYPNPVRDQLGQAMAAVLLLSATIKFKGSLILQAQGEGPLKAVVAQATDQRTVRGIAHWQGLVPQGHLAAVFGSGRLVLTIQNDTLEPHQGVVALEGKNLAEALETYFCRSEQLATRLWLAADENSAAGLFLQQIPSWPGQAEDWNRVATLADTVTPGELLNLPNDQLLFRLFHEERVRVFEPETVMFRCSCSRERIETILLALGRGEVDAMLAEQPAIEVSCEFCNRLYRFDAVDAGLLFSALSPAPRSNRRH